MEVWRATIPGRASFSSYWCPRRGEEAHRIPTEANEPTYDYQQRKSIEIVR